MKNIRFLFRLIRICYVLAKHGVDKLIVSTPLFKALRFIVYLNPWHWCRSTKKSSGRALCDALEELGPIFVKFGQALSTRADIFSAEFIHELSRLQDNVTPFPSEKVHAIIEKAFKQNACDLFQHFDETPLASASIAQVHAATLKNGQEVVVKVLRPKIKALVKKDIHVMYVMAKFLNRYWRKSDRFKPLAIVSEFETTLIDELDLMREAASASQLRRNFLDDDSLYVPEVYWDYTRENILVIERISGIPVADIETIKQAGINLKLLSERGIKIFFTQVFEHCFFHADMHPGNIFINKDKTDSPQYICVDFGIMGTLTDNDKRYLAENLVAFFNRDYRRIALLHIETGWVSKQTRPDAFESAIRTVCEPIFERPLKDISFAQLVLRLFQVGRRFQMEVQPQLILLQKTLLAVEGLGRQIYPNLNLWTTAKPFLEAWVKDELGPKALARNLKENIPFMTEQLPYLPKLTFDVLQGQKSLNEQMLKSQQTTPPSASKFLTGFATAMLVAPVTALTLNQLLNAQRLAILSVIISATGGLILLSKLLARR